MVSIIPSAFNSFKEQILYEAQSLAKGADSKNPFSIVGNLEGAITDTFDIGNYSFARDAYFNYYSGIPRGVEAFTDVGNVSRDNDMKIAFLEGQASKIEYFIQIMADPRRLASLIQDKYSMDKNTAYQLANSLEQEISDKNPSFSEYLEQALSRLKNTKEYLTRVSDMNKTINKKWNDKLGEAINSFA